MLSEPVGLLNPLLLEAEAAVAAAAAVAVAVARATRPKKPNTAVVQAEVATVFAGNV